MKIVDMDSFDRFYDMVNDASYNEGLKMKADGIVEHMQVLAYMRGIMSALFEIDKTLQHYGEKITNE